MDWYYAEEGQTKGPVSKAALDDLAGRGVVVPFTLVWHAGLPGWQPWSTVAPSAPVGGPPPLSALPRVVYAGFWIRFVAYIIDGALISIIRAMILLPLGFGMIDRPFASPWFFVHAGEAQLSSAFVGLVYFVYFWTQYGATPGKMVLKLRVINTHGGPISFGQAVGRYFGQILSGILLGIGFLMAGWDDQKRALHDRLADTRVIRADENMPGPY